MSEISLVDCLKLFNRKERYWLLRNALGKGSNLCLHLDNVFLSKILKTVKISVVPLPQDVWWAMDYHFDWITGALKLYSEQKIEKPEYSELFTSGKPIISGTQEDIDFIISFEKHIILIEAKGTIAWNSKQFSNKLHRIAALKQFINKYTCSDIKIEFLLISPIKPKRLEKSMSQDMSHVKYIQMSIPNDGIAANTTAINNNYRFLKTTRCDQDGNQIQSGKYWKIAPTFKAISN